MTEKRSAVRVPYVTRVECEDIATGARTRGAQLSDISFGGVHVAGIPPFPEGSLLRVWFTLPSLQMDVLAEVVNTTPRDGMGLSFGYITPVQRAVIQKLMEPEEVVVDLEEPAVQPEEPSVEPEPPSVELEEPSVQAEEPSAEPEPLTVELEELAVGPEPPTVELEELAAEPEQPAAGPEHREDDGQTMEAGPIPTDPSKSPPPADGAEVEGEKRPKRILVAEDHDRTRTMLRGMIEGRGDDFAVTEARDGLEAVQMVQEEPPFDLVFLDVDMPRLDGLAACRQMRALGVKVPIIFLTGRGELGDFGAGREAGADTYIKKPIALGTLRSMLGLFTGGTLVRK